eukprot:365108-Chlamydomonas_euryale.AAC.9
MRRTRMRRTRSLNVLMCVCVCVCVVSSCPDETWDTWMGTFGTACGFVCDEGSANSCSIASPYLARPGQAQTSDR